MRNNQISTSQQLVCHVDGRSHVATWVALQVDDQFLHALCLQLSHRLSELIVGSCRKAGHLDVANFLVYHVGGIDAVLWDFGTCDRVLDQIGCIFTLDFYRYFGPARTTQVVKYIPVGDANTGHSLAIH